MSSDLVSGFCETRFQKVRDLFTQSVESDYEVGATLAVEYRGEMVINLWGGYQDAANPPQLYAPTWVAESFCSPVIRPRPNPKPIAPVALALSL